MNNAAHAQAVQEQVKPKFRGRRHLKSKVVTHYPASVEREYCSITNAYMVMLNKIIAKHLPEARKAITQERHGTRYDAAHSVPQTIADVFNAIRREFNRAATRFNLSRRLNAIAALTQKLSISRWKRVIHKTLGIDLLDDYYKGEFMGNALEMWVQKNVDLISTIPKNTLDKMQNIVLDGYRNGTLSRDIGKQIQEAYGISKRHAQFIARDQTAKLNADITRAQQKDAGVKDYEWSTSGDERVRGNPNGLWPKGSHFELNKTRQSWDSPPIVDKRTGRRGHPGEDYRCRCVALPIFDIQGLDLPWGGTESETNN